MGGESDVIDEEEPKEPLIDKRTIRCVEIGLEVIRRW